MKGLKILRKLFKPRKKSGGKAPPSSPEITKLVNNATSRYLSVVGARGLFKKRALYERPWFLVCGPTGSGKSSLLSTAGMDSAASYPDESDGFVDQEGVQIQWRFADGAVWIDIDGHLVTEEGSAEFESLVGALHSVRPLRPLDGIVMVCAAGTLQEGAQEDARDLAVKLRRCIDKAITVWGVELPVYLVFSKADEIVGFKEIFGDPSGKWDERVLGSAMQEDNSAKLPRFAFLEEFGFVLDSVKDIQVKMLARERRQSARRRICEFPIHLEALRERMSVLVAMLYRPSTYEGKPRLGGFYFTSCPADDQQVAEEPEEEQSLDISNTVFSHPLNPKKPQTKKSRSKKRSREQPSFFVRSLFLNVLPAAPQPITRTQKHERHEKMRVFKRAAVAGVSVAAVLWIVWAMTLGVQSNEKQLRKDLSASPTLSAQGIKRLAVIKDHFERYRTYAEGRRTIPMIVSGYNAEKSYRAVRDAYYSSLRTVVVEPCSTILCRSLINMINLPDNSPENDFGELKRTFRAYLSISAAGRSYDELIVDESGIVSTLRKAMLKGVIRKRSVSEPLDSALTSVITSYVALLKKNSNPPVIRSDKPLISRVQLKLVSLFDADAVYETVLAKCLRGADKLFLKDIVDESGSFAMNTDEPLSGAFTPEGWNDQVRNQILEASRRLETIEDWVIGNNRNRISEAFIDPEHLQTEMVTRYLEDTKSAWRDYLSSLNTEQFTDMEDAKKKLLELSGDRSIIALVSGRLKEWIGQFEPDSAGTMKEALAGFGEEMAFVGEFNSARLGEYQKRLADVAEGVETAVAEGSIAGVFNGHKDDPLVAAYDHVGSTMLPSMGDLEKVYFHDMLMNPLRRTIELVRLPLCDEINEAWRAEVYDVFAGSCSGQYPFVDVETEALYSVVMSLFEPQTGAIWRTYENYLSPYLMEKHGKWSRRKLAGMIPLEVSPGLTTCLTHAKRITEVFYKSDGSPRTWSISITPQTSNLTKAQIVMDKTAGDLIAKREIRLMWPISGGKPGIRLTF
ncbi:MAG: hypothetical protein GF344_07435, partial [Chitinivibrionales bacterium]|nr:hypothetical protein [Chitinivibrionales bacterium]MBD3356740.1 hypothetical protein [Chitinivibrionales bacterium]